MLIFNLLNSVIYKLNKRIEKARAQHSIQLAAHTSADRLCDTAVTQGCSIELVGRSIIQFESNNDLR